MVSIPGEGVYPRCEACGMQTNPSAVSHRSTKACREGAERKHQHEAAVEAALALRQQFTAYGDVLDRVEAFKYLGRLLSYDDNDVQAMRANLRKARRTWGRISRVLRAENASPRVCGMFYKATVQAVLLFGSESWCLSDTAMKRLEGFHVRAAWRMARENKPRRRADGTWSYPETDAVLEEVGLHSISHYVGVRRATIATFIVNRPIYEACVAGERKRGSAPRKWWWEQPLGLEADAEGTDCLPAVIEGWDR